MSIPTITPITDLERPTWSVMIPAWNAADHLEAAISSVLAAGIPAGSQIEVVDDGSTDETPVIAAAFGDRGVTYHRNSTQRGASGNFNACIERARGRFVHLLHADDEVLPGFYATMEAALETDPAIVAAFARTAYIDESGRELLVTRSEGPTGVWERAVEVLSVSNRVRPPGIVVRRDAYESVGGYREDLTHAADWEMWVRLAMRGPIWFEDAVLARYRRHPGQDTATRLRRAANVRERVAALAMIGARLPRPARRRAMRRGLWYASVFAGRTALALARRAEWSAASAQALAAVRCAVAGVVASPRLAGAAEGAVEVATATDTTPLRPGWVILTMGTRPDALEAAVRSARSQTRSGPVHVVAQGTDATIPEGAIPVRLPSNVGIPAGRDRGMTIADTDVVFFLDDDARYVDAHVASAVLHRMEADPSLAAVSLRLVDETGATLQRHVPRIGRRSASRSGPVTTFLGGACALRRDAYLAVGGYHGDFFYGHEEMDLAWRLLDAGYRIEYLAEPAVVHPHLAISSVDPDRWRLLGRNRVWLARRRLPHPLDWIHAALWLGIEMVRTDTPDERRNFWSGWVGAWRDPVERRPLRWSTVVEMARLGRPPLL